MTATEQAPRVLEVAFPDGDILEMHVLSGLDAARRGGARRLRDTWMLVFDAGLEALIDAKLTVSDYRIFFALISRAPITGGEWEIRSRLMSERLQMDERRVRRGIAKLTDQGLIRRSRRGYVEFNPDLMWRGSAKSRVEARTLSAVDDGEGESA